MVIYSWGSRGNTVRQIQQRLKNWGYYNGSVDGVYGEATWRAVRDFQAKNSLRVDGIVGEATLEKIGLPTGSSSSSSSTSGTANASQSDIDLIASAIYGEGRGEPYEGQVAIGAVILNRVESPDFPNTIRGVIYQSGAFDAVKDGQINLTPNQTAYNAAIDALNGWDPSEGALYYWNPVTATIQWIWTVPITKQIGNHVFGIK